MAVAQAAKTVADSFFGGLPHPTRAGLCSSGTELTLYGHKIAEWRGDALYVRVNGIENATVDTRGWRLTPEKREAMRRGDFEHNPTTIAKLGLLPHVSVGRTRGKLVLNGKAWDGRWVQVYQRVQG